MLPLLTKRRKIMRCVLGGLMFTSPHAIGAPCGQELMPVGSSSPEVCSYEPRIMSSTA